MDCSLPGCSVHEILQARGLEWVAISFFGASLGAQLVKKLPAVQETGVQSLDREDPLEKGMAVFLPEEFHGQSSLVGYSPRGCKELDTTEQLTAKKSAP